MKSLFLAASLFLASLFGAHPAGQPFPVVPSAAAVSTFANNQLPASPLQFVTSAAWAAQTVPGDANIAKAEVLGNSMASPHYVTQDQFAALTNNLRSLVYAIAASSTRAVIPEYIAASGNPENPFAANSAIDQLTGTTLNNITVNGVAGLTTADIPSLNYLSSSGGMLAGSLSDTATTSSYFSGSLGIGTTSPSAPLELYGSNSSTNLTTGGGTFEAITNADQTSGNFDSLSYREVNSAGLEVTGTRISGVFNSHIAGAESADLAFLTRNAGTLSEKLRITGAGNVGIGTTSPATTLSVVGTVSATDNGASSVAQVGNELTTDGSFTTDPASVWTLGSSWSWDSTNSRAQYSGVGGPIASISIDNGGIGYTNGDTITISGGSGNATYTATVSSGKVTALTQTSGGTAYTSGTGISTTGGTGTGLVVSVTRIAAGGTISQNITASSGGNSLVAFTIANYSGNGLINVSLNGPDTYFNATSTYYQANGTYSVVLPNGSTVIFTPTEDFSAEITNISVKPLTPSSAVAQINNVDGTAGIQLRPGESTTQFNTFIGLLAGSLNTTSHNNSALSYEALYSNTTGSNNTAIGATSLFYNTTASNNTAVGSDALFFNTTGSSDSAVGANALDNNTTGIRNAAFGASALQVNTTGQNNTGVGANSLLSNTIGSFNTAEGASSFQFNVSGNDDTAMGYRSLSSNTTGSNNTALGYQAAFDLTTGSSNIVIGANVDIPVVTGSQQLNIGNTIYGTGLYNSGSGLSSTPVSGAKVGIGTSSPNSILEVSASNNGSTLTTFGDPTISITNRSTTNNSFSTLAFRSQDLTNGSASSTAQISGIGTSHTATQISGALAFLTQNSGSLTEKARINAAGNFGIGTINPFSRLQVSGPDAASSTSAFAVVNSASTTVFAVFDGGNAQLSGALTQSSDQRLKTNVQSLDASSLSLIDALNPVTFNWIDSSEGAAPQLGFIAQQVQQIFPYLVSTTSPTALTPDGTLGLNYIGLISPIVKSIQVLYADVQTLEQTVAGFAQTFTTNRLCVNKSDGTPVCVTGDQLSALLAGQQDTSSPSPVLGPATTMPPTIAINGDNPAYINVGDAYSDLGATITGPQADLNLGIKTFLNGALISNIVIDTSQAATDTIDYVATDIDGNTATSTRTVIVEPLSNTVTFPATSSSANTTTP